MASIPDTVSTGKATVVGVVPTYRPDGDVASRLVALAKQVDRVIVVDDGSGPAADAVLRDITRDGITVLRRKNNGGIAAALNVGVREALAAGADYVLTQDQDSLLPADYVSRGLDIFMRSTPVTHVGVVCCDRVNGAPALPRWVSPEGLGLVPEAIQTGFLISRECLEAVGIFDERLVIDGVDHEYCLRARARGFRVAINTGTDIGHALGTEVPLRPFGMSLKDRNGNPRLYQYHSPFRRYYMTRNNIDLLMRYARGNPRLVAATVRREYRAVFTTFFSGPERVKHLVAFSAGAADAFRRRRGLLPNRLKNYLKH